MSDLEKVDKRRVLDYGSIWRALSQAEDGMSRGELLETIGRRYSSVENILIAMEREGYLVSEDEGRFYAFERIEISPGWMRRWTEHGGCRGVA